jgi:H+-transporting ATPase
MSLRWKKMPSRLLVPGDLIELKLGDVVPADAVLLPGTQMQVDQSALTGESLPVNIHPGGKLKMGSAIKRGENHAVVVGTGRFTFFGKAADMLNSVEVVGRFQKIVFQITIWLMAISLFLTVIIFVRMGLGRCCGCVARVH